MISRLRIRRPDGGSLPLALRVVSGTCARALCAALLVANAASAQVVEKAVKFILPNATGSGVDTITRSAQPALAKALGMPIIVENQPGAGGIVGVQAITRAAPDGMTLGIVSN